ncbi:hypothetical protein [Microcoleus phage My-WqHQDG]|nr:hypothetical protein [Microcoleus phage My-WqHQDG]
MKHLLGLPYVYEAQYRIKLTLGLYGYSYNIYSHKDTAGWSWYQYLCGDLGNRPNPIMSFSDHEDAWAYLNKYPQLGLYIRRERYVP